MLRNINSKEFLDSLRSGSEESFTQLFNTFNTDLCSYAYRILGDHNEAKEVVHITFCKIWDNRRSIEINESLKAYLYKSVYNNCISQLRKKRQYSKYVELGLGDLYFNRIVQNPHAELKLIDSESRKIPEHLSFKCSEICNGLNSLKINY